MRNSLLFLILYFCATPAGLAMPAQDRPNIILIVADDMGYGDLGCYGQQMILTPNIDALARNGMRFTNFYSGSTVCAPSRNALLTGRHTGHTYIRGNFATGDPEGDLSIPSSDKTIAEYLKPAGYETAIIGKWGLGSPGEGPNTQGFDYSFCYLDQISAHDYYPEHVWENEKKFPLAGNLEGKKQDYTHDVFVSRTLEYIGDREAGNPFFLYLPYTIPHGQHVVPDDRPYHDKDWPQNYKNYAAMITRLDRDIGRIAGLLQKKGLAENTLLLFTSDNGANAAFARFFKSNGDFRGTKRDLYDGGIRVPFIACWPGTIRPGVSDHLAAAWDLLPTICEVAGQPVPDGSDGLSLLPELTGGKQAEPDFLYWEYYAYNWNWEKPNNRKPRNWLESRGVRFGDWKVIQHATPGSNNAPVEVFDLRNDPGERTDVAARHPDIVRKALGMMDTSSTHSPYYPYPAKLLDYLESRKKEDGGYGWGDQPDGHLQPSFATTGILYDLGMPLSATNPLAGYIRTHHPQFGVNKEAGGSGAEVRSLVYMQLQALSWLGNGRLQDDDLTKFRKQVAAWESQAGNIAHYEKQGYPVFMQEMMTPICRELLGLPADEELLPYLQSRRRSNGSFNNTPSTDGGDGNILNTYWGLKALRVYEDRDSAGGSGAPAGGSDDLAEEHRDPLRDATVDWIQACQTSGGGFTHQPNPLIGGNTDVSYTWAAVNALAGLDAKPHDKDGCIQYLLSLRNEDGGFGKQPGLPSSPMSTWYAVDALKTLDALSHLVARSQLERLYPANESANNPANSRADGDTTPTEAPGIFTVQFQAQGSGSPAEAVMLADSLGIHLWGAKNASADWVREAQRIADAKKVSVTFFHSDESYGQYLGIHGMGAFSHVLDPVSPAGHHFSYPADSIPWKQFSDGYLPALEGTGGALLLQISNNEPLTRMLLDEAVAGKGHAAISTIHFSQNFLFFLPWLYQYRHDLPFVALQDAHGTESWWWIHELSGYRTLFTASEATYEEMIRAMKENRMAAVRHDAVSGYKTRMLGGTRAFHAYLWAHQDQWQWWKAGDNREIGDNGEVEDSGEPWAAVTVVRPADSFEVARPEKGTNIRLRCLWRSNRNVLKEPLVTPVELTVDGRVIIGQYIEAKDRRGRITDSYYLYSLPRLKLRRKKEHSLRVKLRRLESGELREIRTVFR